MWRHYSRHYVQGIEKQSDAQRYFYDEYLYLNYEISVMYNILCDHKPQHPMLM